MGTFPHSPTASQVDVFLFQHPIAGEMFKTQMLNKVFIRRILACHVSSLHCSICEKLKERNSEHISKLPGKSSTPQMCHPHQPEASTVSRCLPGCSCQDFSYQAAALFLCLAESKPQLLWRLVFMCGNRREQAFWKQQGDKVVEGSGTHSVKQLLSKGLNLCLFISHKFNNSMSYSQEPAQVLTYLFVFSALFTKSNCFSANKHGWSFC